jgi:hypothetical protein
VGPSDRRCSSISASARPKMRLDKRFSPELIFRSLRLPFAPLFRVFLISPAAQQSLA